MQQQNSGMSCPLGSWALAAGVGLLLVILLLVIGDWGFIGAVFMGAIAFAILGLLFNWIFCRDLPAPRGAGNIDGAAASSSSTASAAAEPTAAATAETAKEEATPVAEPASAPAAKAESSDDSRSVVKPSAPLAGQEELAARKGEWKYEGDGKAEAKPAEATSTPDYDGDGKLEGSGEGAKPATLTEAREGGPDNLKEIKGVGPKLEQLLHSMGFYHFDQIANWTDDEVAWVNANLEGFKGRVSRDNWVEQAKILASGGDTEFSKRVDDGDVY